jgi:sigma-B regulation protein RsbU (phosphoserine phosphatase)
MQQEIGLERALAAANSGITLADATREGFPLTFVNAAFERLTGYGRDEVLDRNCRFLQGPGTDPAAVAALSAALRDARECEVVLLNYRKDGSPFYNELRIAPVFDDAGRCVQIIGVQNDVSEVVRAQRSLRRATRVIAEQDQQLAELRVLQRALTPAAPPARPHLELASCFVAAEDGVAGDFYLVAPGPGDTTVVVVGDVIGHGLEAARRATFVRTALATFSRFTDDPLRLLEMANHVLIERAGTSTEFVTAVCASFRPDEERIVWASAGHPAPIDLRTGEPLGGTQGGVPLGIEIDLGATSISMSFADCDGLLLFTDGLPEARGVDAPRSARARLGDDRVREVVRSMPGASCDAIVAALRDAATTHAQGRFADDVCVIAARVRPGG